MQTYKTYNGKTVTVDKRLDYRQAGLRYYDNGDAALISYTTEVLYYNATADILNCFGLYSATTRRHISIALRKYFHNPILDYYDIKYLGTLGYGWGIKNPFGKWFYYNINTGEILEPIK